jgi:hexosaminidase
VSDTGTTAIKANSVYGAMRALETFTQLVHRLDKQSNNERYLPGVPLTIDDQPEYAHRGLLLDTARSYYPVGDILRQLDGMAMTKLNVFHWHIADSQSFPVMSEVLPRLAQYGAYGPNMIYTKQDIQSVVQYARERGIRVIPEYDTPGHTYAWGLAYPNLIVCSNQQPKWNDVAAEPPSGQLDPTNPESLNLVAKLIKEQATWFTDPYFHVGGDEVNQKCYTQEPHIAKYLEQHKMSVSQLIGEFAQGLHAAVRENHKIPITWEEALREYKVKMGNDTIVQVWKSPSHIKDVLQQGLRVIVSISSHWYLDRGQGDWMWSIDDKDPECDPYRSWQHMYAHNIIQGLEATGNVDRSHPNVLGGEVALWSEKSDAYVLDMRVWPRAGAVAEKLWSGNKDADGQIYNSKDALPRIYKLRHRLLQQGFRADPISMPWCELHPGSCDRYKFE